ncbi:hypothetical protein [Polaromonas sp.]|uniref:hypothetical protein n=1 Tax=Polaromonas sp. TaxID=1869339 RepID=UPI0025EB2963|nr:hypothetical protein [Polaromonas sp.]
MVTRTQFDPAPQFPTHFSQAVLQPWGIEVQYPDEFVMNQLQLHQIPVLSAIKKMRAR